MKDQWIGGWSTFVNGRPTEDGRPLKLWLCERSDATEILDDGDIIVGIGSTQSEALTNAEDAIFVDENGTRQWKFPRYSISIESLVMEK